VENVVDAICLAGAREQAVGQIYNIVDDDPISSEQYVNELIRRTGAKAAKLHVPFGFIYVGASLLEAQAKLTKKAPFLTRYRLVCATKDVQYDTSRAKDQLGWRPKVSLQEGLTRTFDWYNGKERQH
jgi:nucleoside-diphosphate-sugar epimerase